MLYNVFTIFNKERQMKERFMIESAAPYKNYKQRKEENKLLKEASNKLGYSLMGWPSEMEAEKRACELQRFTGIQTMTSPYAYVL